MKKLLMIFVLAMLCACVEEETATTEPEEPAKVRGIYGEMPTPPDTTKSELR